MQHCTVCYFSLSFNDIFIIHDNGEQLDSYIDLTMQIIFKKESMKTMSKHKNNKNTMKTMKTNLNNCFQLSKNEIKQLKILKIVNK